MLEAAEGGGGGIRIDIRISNNTKSPPLHLPKEAVQDKRNNLLIMQTVGKREGGLKTRVHFRKQTVGRRGGEGGDRRVHFRESKVTKHTTFTSRHRVIK